MAVALADKRINQADKEKWVVENSIHTDWIDLLKTSEAETAFFNSLKFEGLPFSHFFAFYQALMKRVVALKCAEHSHSFSLENVAQEGFNNRLDTLREIEKLGANKSDLANKLKKEKQMGKQVDLNTQIKNINDKIAKIKSSL